MPKVKKNELKEMHKLSKGGEIVNTLLIWNENCKDKNLNI